MVTFSNEERNAIFAMMQLSHWCGYFYIWQTIIKERNPINVIFAMQSCLANITLISRTFSSYEFSNEERKKLYRCNFAMQSYFTNIFIIRVFKWREKETIDTWDNCHIDKLHTSMWYLQRKIYRQLYLVI